MKHLSCSRKLLVLILPALILTITGIGLEAGAFSPPLSGAGSAGSYRIIDSPLNPGSSTPVRQVIQVIDNELHIWVEYVDSSNRVKYLHLLEPFEKPLKASEATALLDSSRIWEEQAAAFASQKILELNRQQAEAPENKPAEDYSPNCNFSHQYESQPAVRQEGMEDRRSPIDNMYALSYPYNTIGLLNVDFPESFMRSTAFLIGPNLALTNAHNIYSPELGGWYERIEFTAAQYETEWPHTIKPYSTRRPTHVETNDKFYQYENEEDRDMAVKYDYAALFFDQPYAEITTFIPIEFNYIPEQVAVIGYPGVVRDIKTNGLWKSDGALIDYNDYCLYYDAYTSGGNSGSPVLAYRPQADTYRVVAIHAFASPGYFSGGPHFNDKNRPVIENWLKTASEHIQEDISSVSLNKSTLVMQKGQLEALVATTIPENMSELKLSWTSSDPAIAEVTADGIITALKEGETLITVSAGNDRLKDECRVTVTAAPEEDILKSIPGDINEDQVVNVMDVVLVLHHVLEINELDSKARFRADVNGDGRVDILDASLIMQYALGIIKDF